MLNLDLQSEWQGYNNESDNGSSQGYFSSSTVECLQQPRPKADRPTELILTTKEFEDGYADTETQSSKTAYLEQFWMCAKRLKKNLFVKKFIPNLEN